MADVNSPLYAEQQLLYKPATGNTAFPKQVTYKIPVEAPSDSAITDGQTLALFDLPVGCTVRPDLSSALWSAGTSASSSLAIELGDAADDNRYMVSDSALTALFIPSLIHSSTIPDGVTNPYVVTEANKTLLATIAIGGGTFSAGESAGHINLVVDLP
jgi:hypothetical protein